MLERSQPVVSVLLPVYNGEAVVEEAIRSIREQTFTDWELLIGDDGSTDRTLEICREYAELDPRIRLFPNERNLNVSRTRNRLLREARAPFIAFQDADDISLPTRFAHELAVFFGEPDVGVVCGVAAWLDDKDEIYGHFPWLLSNGLQFPPETTDLVELLYVRGNKVVLSTAMVRKEAALAVEGPFDPEATRCGDWQFFIHLAHRYRFYGLPEILVRMRRGGSRESLTVDKSKFFPQSQRCLKTLLGVYRDDPESPISPELYRRAMSNELLWEARWYGGLRGLPRLIRAFTYNPRNTNVRKELREIPARGVRKLRRSRPEAEPAH